MNHPYRDPASPAGGVARVGVFARLAAWWRRRRIRVSTSPHAGGFLLRVLAPGLNTRVVVPREQVAALATEYAEVPDGSDHVMALEDGSLVLIPPDVVARLRGVFAAYNVRPWAPPKKDLESDVKDIAREVVDAVRNKPVKKGA